MQHVAERSLAYECINLWTGTVKSAFPGQLRKDVNKVKWKKMRSDFWEVEIKNIYRQHPNKVKHHLYIPHLYIVYIHIITLYHWKDAFVTVIIFKEFRLNDQTFGYMSFFPFLMKIFRWKTSLLDFTVIPRV